MKIATNIERSDFHTQSSPVSGICLKVDEISFPDSGWTDFLVIVLHWWLQEYLRQLSGQKLGRYEFMDGPFFYEIDMQDGEYLSVVGYEERLDSIKQVFRADVKAKLFLASLKAASNHALRMCHWTNFSSPDVENLERSLREMQRIGSG